MPRNCYHVIRHPQNGLTVVHKRRKPSNTISSGTTRFQALTRAYKALRKESQ